MSRYPKSVAEFADCSEDSGSDDSIGPRSSAGERKLQKSLVTVDALYRNRVLRCTLAQ
jgi:hypothetical protein